MRLPLSLATSCSLLVLFAACGGDEENEGTTDGGTSGSGSGSGSLDASAPSTVNCDPLDLAAAPAINIVTQQVTPNPQAGAISPAIYKLASVKLYASGIPVTGTAKARVDIDPSSGTAGAARVSIKLDAAALGQMIQQEVTGAGLYTIAGSNLTVADGCGGTEPIPVLSYTATATALTLWTEYMVTDPVALTIPIELGLVAE